MVSFWLHYSIEKYFSKKTNDLILMDVSKHYKWLLILFGIWPILDLILNLTNINLPVLRYAIYSVGTVYVLKLYFMSNKNSKNLSAKFRIVFKVALFWLFIRLLLSSYELFNPFNNYISLKYSISGGFILFLSFYLTNITIPLKYFKFFLKTSYILAIIFLIIGIPMFGFFTGSSKNGAEVFVTYFYLGSVFLLLLFPYQSNKVNLVSGLGFITATLMMLIIARRNVVLYLGSSIFILSLVILFSKSQITKKRKPFFVAGSIVIVLGIVVFVILFNFNFGCYDALIDSNRTSGP